MREAPYHLALVTGASSGIGGALARLLAHRGISLLITARDTERLKTLSDELGKFVPVTIVIADLTVEGDRQRLIEKVHELQPDLVVNNAGFGLYGEAVSYETKENVKMIRLNIEALVEITLESAKTLIRIKRRGVILNVSSLSDLLVFPGLSLYAATKAFVTQMSQSLDAELAPKGVRVLAACPGVVRTAFRQSAGGRPGSPEGPIFMEPEDAAKEIWKQIVKRKKVYYFDWRSRLSRFCVRFLIPQTIVSKFLFKTIKSYTHTE